MDRKQIEFSAKRTIRLEAESVAGLQNYVNEDFVRVVEMVHASTGRLIVSGIGKSAIIAQKIVATLNSTGTPSLYLHAADAIHGDLGMVQQEDVVLIISNSGNSSEIKVLASLVKSFGNKIIAMVGNTDSFLARHSDFLINTTILEEACPNNLAPTSSTTAQMVMGDALAICLMEQHGFTSADFARFHPGGIIGKKLYLRVRDLYIENEKPQVRADQNLKEVIVEMTKTRLGVTAVVNDAGHLIGIITDGDLRRMLEKDISISTLTARDIMTASPKTIAPGELAVEALELMRKYGITQLAVTEDEHYLGIVHLHDLVKEGLI